MSLRTAILAALVDGEASGYDLTRDFGTTVANFWSATPQQLYRELDRLEAEGLIVAEVVAQERRPTKRVFRLTPAGVAAVGEFTRKPPKTSAIRDDLLVQIQAVDAGDAAAVAGSIAARVAEARHKLARYERRREAMLAGRTERDFLATAERIGPYLTLARGIAFEKENIRWGTKALTALRARARGGPAVSRAAGPTGR